LPNQIFKAISRLFLFGALLALPACFKQMHVEHEEREAEARYYDLPIPIGCQASFEDNERGILAQFKTALSIDEIREFYLAEMECFGWKLVTEFLGTESMLLFERPSRWLTITIKSDGRINRVSLISCNKEGSHYGEPS
jgi:hypothetical protein